MTQSITQPNMIRGVLFDLDGTLIDSAQDLAAAANQMRQVRHLAPLPLDDYRPFAGAGARGMLGVAFQMKPDHADFLAMREEFFCVYERIMLNNTQPFDGILAMLDTLRAQGIVWGVVTNKMSRFTTPLMAQLPWAHDCAAIVCGDTTAHPKPHPAPMQAALAQLNLAPQECLYVGDDARDILAGHAAGIISLAAMWGYMGETPVDQWGADGLLQSAQDLSNWLHPHTTRSPVQI